MRLPAAPLHPSLPARPGGPARYEQQQQQQQARNTPPSDWHAEHNEAAERGATTNELPQKPRKKIVTPPNQSVILIGIPLPATEEDVKSFIDEFKANPEDPSPVDNVSIVRDKQTGQSKRFGFIRFISLEHARGMSKVSIF
jgi:RNA recognition motif-containing protein